LKPLVSILMPAYNAQEFIAESIQSALAQTWPRKEIIVVDDGSTDRTAAVAGQFESRGVRVVTKENEGAAATRNFALKVCNGDYIQWLDADDLLSTDKIERQISALPAGASPRLLLSAPWALFDYRPERARFVPTPLWEDLSPVEWLLRKMSQNLHMQTATWLTSRELAERAGAWDTRLISDDDGEYFCRVLLASEGTRFVPEARVFYRKTAAAGRVSYIGRSNEKKTAMLVSMKLHIAYLRSLEESERVRLACLTYMQNWLLHFYPERLDIVMELQKLAAELNGSLSTPRLRRKYAWMVPLLGWKTAKEAQMMLPEIKARAIGTWDKAMYRLEHLKPFIGHSS